MFNCFNWEVNPETNHTETISSLSEFESVASTINTGIVSEANTLTNGIMGDVNSLENDKTDENNIINKYRVKPQHVVSYTGSVAEESLNEFHKSDPVRLYHESCLSTYLPLPSDCGNCVLDYHVFVPNIDFYASFDDKLRLVCDEILERNSNYPSYQGWKNKFDLDYDEEMNRILNGFEHQSGGDAFVHMKLLTEKLSKVGTFKAPPEFYFQLEGVCIMVTGLMSSTTTGSAVAHICAFARSLSGDSVASMVKKCLDKISWSDQDFGGGEDWLSLLRSARTNWKMVLDNPHFTNMQNVLSIIVSLGLCQSRDVAFTVWGVKLFTQYTSKKQASAVDLLDAVLTTIVTFVEGGFECFKQRSFKPLLHGDVELASLVERCERCDRLAEFSKTGDIERAEEHMTAALYFKFLSDTIDMLKDLRKITRSVHTIRMIDMRLDKMHKYRIEFERNNNSAGLRQAPWGILVNGRSGVGKSSVANILMISSLKVNNFPAADEHLFYNNEHDRFDSQLKSSCTGMYFDDMANTKLEFSQVAPAANIIQTINNVRAYGNMADVDEKGKVLKEPKVVLTTTNVKNLKSTEQSECPLSIERRNAYILTVTVKKEFERDSMLNQEMVTEYYKKLNMEVPVVPDLWLFDVERAVGTPNPTPGRPELVQYVPIKFEGKDLMGVDIRTVLRYNKQASRIHFANQKVLVENQTNLHSKMDWCEGCSMPGVYCECPRDLEDQFGAMIAQFAISAFNVRRNRVVSCWERFNSDLEAATLQIMTARLAKMENSCWLKWTNYIPSDWLEDETVQAAILYCNRTEMRRNICKGYGICFLIIFFSFLIALIFPHICTLGAAIIVTLRCLLQFGRIVEHEKVRLYALVADQNDNMDEAFKDHRDAAVKYITGGCLLLGTIYALVCIWKEVRLISLEPQGNLCPETMEDVKERDAEAVIEREIAVEQGWDQVPIAPVPCSEASKTATTQQLCNKLYKNMTQFVWKNKAGKDCGCDLVFVESNIAILPKHIWYEDEMKITISRGNNKIQKFEVILSRSHSYDIGDSELCLVYIPNAGSWASLVDYLPHVTHVAGKKLPSKFIYKNMRKALAERLECDTVIRYGVIPVLKRKYYGATYELAFPTFNGLCMGGLVSNTKEALILGFHTAGKQGDTQGAMCSIVRSEYEEARRGLADIPGVCLVASEGVLHPQMFGKDILISKTIHDKSPLHKLPEDAHLDVYGTCTGRAKYFSDVVETPIADTVSSVCGFEKCFDKPKFHLGDAWEKSLQVSCKPSVGVEASLLVHAVEDYVDSLIEKLDKIPGLADNVHPLSRMQNVCGIDGVRFIDKLNPQTSIGYPLSGPKQKYLTLLDPDDYPDFACPAELDEMFWIEADRMESEYKEGRRCHTPFKACLKDEPTKVTKDKVRTFQGAPTAFQLVIRKYFLPIVRLLSVFPLTSECAVGINTMGPEFDTLVKHMRKHGDDRIFAGDYSKYDLRMPAQLILAAFDVLIEIARHYNYSDEDILVMRGVASDIAYPVMAYNGDLVQHYGSNPSGQNLTVYINSIVNSLLMRTAYYHIYKDRKVPSFDKAVSVMTYGDDVKGSVRIGFDEFNHLSYTAFLAERDIVFTMPDKESTPTKYMLDEEADFLKRKNVYSSDLNLWMGALDEDSIFKSLTSVKKSNAISLLEQSMQNIDGALREWFAYGREHYEQRREQMRLIANKHSIQGGCDMLNVSFDDCLERYRTRYGLSPPCKK